MQKILFSCLTALLAVGFIGCGSGMPSCDSKDTKKLLTQIIKDELQKAGVSKANLEKLKIGYEAFMTNSSDKEAKKVMCKAQANISFGNEKNSEFIEYSAQHTSDGQLYVEIYE